MNRYENKPLLRLLECYVLAVIGKLSDEQSVILRKMEPKLSSVYQKDGTWLDILSKEMDFPDSLPTKIRTIWEQNAIRMQACGKKADPIEFAISFVDTNFGEYFKNQD